MRVLRFGAVFLALTVFSVFVVAACGSSTSPDTDKSPADSTTQSGEVDLPSKPTAPSQQSKIDVPEAVPEDLKAVWEAYALLKREFVDQSKIDPTELSEAAIEGMLKALDDPYTAYIDPESYALELSDTQGRFEGIGAEVNMTPDGRLMIIAPLPGTPAEAAGIKSGDVILEVDGKSIQGLSLLEAVLKIRGPRGSSVRLLVKRLFDENTVVIEIVRGVIRVSSVNMNMTDEQFAYIHLRVFYENTITELKDALEEAEAKGAKGIILDMRNNPGGLLTAAVEVASQFLKDGLVLYEVDGSGRRTDWNVRRGGLAVDTPMIVLANEFSASGSEVVLGALQDHNRATFVGNQTFGKGSVNIIRSLSNGGGLFLTFAHWYTPDGRLIEGEGLEPDIKVNQSANQREDSQFNKAVEVLQSMIAASAK